MKIGFVGCGNMATAIIGGILEKGILKKEDIKASTKTENSAKKVQETLGIECTTDNKKAVIRNKIRTGDYFDCSGKETGMVGSTVWSRS